MSSMQMVTEVTTKRRKKYAEEIAKILRKNYADSDAVIKRIAREAEVKSSAVKTWCEGRKTPNLESFIKLSQTYSELTEWFLCQIERDDLADIIKAQKAALKSDIAKYDFDIACLIFETEDSGNILKIMQKLTLRQLWFYGQIKQGQRLCAKDLIYIFDISRATAYRDIDELLKLNLLCRVGRGQDEYYSIL